MTTWGSIGPKWKHENLANAVERQAPSHIEARIRRVVDMANATPQDWIWETLAVLESEGRIIEFKDLPSQPDSAAQPEYTIASAIAQIEACHYECEAGKLENNTAFIWLKSHAK